MQINEHASALVSFIKESNYFESKSITYNRIDTNLTIKQCTVFRYFLSVAWPTEVQLLVFFCSSVPVMLFDTQGSPGVGRNKFLSSPHLCFIIVFICDYLFPGMIH